ncbi:hypothetical protein ACFLU6_01915 [Acidobacteriota bacterium]
MKPILDSLRLLTVRFRALWNTLAHFTFIDVLKVSTLFLLGLFFVAVEFWFFNRLFGILKEQEVLSPFFVRGLIERLLGMVFLTALSMLLFSSIVSAISTVFLASDSSLLISSPVSPLSVFTVKYLETGLNSATMVIAFTAPILFAYGWCFEAGFSYYLVAALVLILIIIPPCTVGLGITLGLVRFLPARRTQQILLIGGFMSAITLIMLIRLLQPEKLLNPETTDDLKRLLEGMTFPALDFLPSTWATRSLLASITGNTKLMFTYLGRLAILGSGLIVLLYWAASATYLKALSRAAESAGIRKKKSLGSGGDWFDRSLGFLHPTSRSILAKDIRSFMRDTSQWSQLFLLGALVIIYLFNIKILPQEQLSITTGVSLKDFISWLNMGLTGVVLAALALRFVYPITSMEGRAFWILKSSPLRLGPILFKRFIIHLIPLLILAELLVFASNLLLKADRFIHVLSLILVLLMTITLIAMAAGMGAMSPRFKHLSHAQIAMGSGGMLFMILSMLYIAAIMAASFRPVYFHFFEQWTGEDIVTLEPLWYYGLILAISAACTLIPIILGARKLDRTDF